MSSGLCKNLKGATVSDEGIEFKNPQKPLDERLYKEIKETNIKGVWRCEIGGNWSGTGWGALGDSTRCCSSYRLCPSIYKLQYGWAYDFKMSTK